MDAHLRATMAEMVSYWIDTQARRMLQKRNSRNKELSAGLSLVVPFLRQSLSRRSHPTAAKSSAADRVAESSMVCPDLEKALELVEQRAMSSANETCENWKKSSDHLALRGHSIDSERYAKDFVPGTAAEVTRRHRRSSVGHRHAAADWSSAVPAADSNAAAPTVADSNAAAPAEVDSNAAAPAVADSNAAVLVAADSNCAAPALAVAAVSRRHCLLCSNRSSSRRTSFPARIM